jgi:hypothetical protein
VSVTITLPALDSCVATCSDGHSVLVLRVKYATTIGRHRGMARRRTAQMRLVLRFDNRSDCGFQRQNVARTLMLEGLSTVYTDSLALQPALPLYAWIIANDASGTVEGGREVEPDLRVRTIGGLGIRLGWCVLRSNHGRQQLPRSIARMCML